MRLFAVIMAGLLLFIGGCGTGDSGPETVLSGYLIIVDEGFVLNEQITEEDFDNLSKEEIYEKFYYESIRLNVNDIDDAVLKELKVGQKVEVTIIGGIAESAPGLGKVKKIVILE